MPYTQEQHERRQLDRWSRYLGYADFATYVNTGGSVTEAMGVLRNLHDSLGMAMRAVATFVSNVTEDREPVPPPLPGEPVVGDVELSRFDVALRRLESEVTGTMEAGEEPDALNAHPQGADVAAG